jgi:hypothetical protein
MMTWVNSARIIHERKLPAARSFCSVFLMMSVLGRSTRIGRGLVCEITKAGFRVGWKMFSVFNINPILRLIQNHLSRFWQITVFGLRSEIACPSEPLIFNLEVYPSQDNSTRPPTPNDVHLLH